MRKQERHHQEKIWDTTSACAYPFSVIPAFVYFPESHIAIRELTVNGELLPWHCYEIGRSLQLYDFLICLL